VIYNYKTFYVEAKRKRNAFILTKNKIYHLEKFIQQNRLNSQKSSPKFSRNLIDNHTVKAVNSHQKSLYNVAQKIN